nr:hypothetical protein [Corynebacterium anserum]
MSPTIIDTDTGRVLWRSIECAEHCQFVLRTWSSYVSRKQAPQPVAHLDARTPLWDAEEVKAWHAQRPSQVRR